MMEKSSSKRAYAVCTAAAMVLFAVQMLYIHANLEYAGSWGQTAAISALFSLAAGIMLCGFVKLKKPTAGELGLTCSIVCVTALARVSMLDYVSSDYQSFLVGWLDVFRTGGFKTLGENVGDYNLIYQYVLLLISKAPLKDLYLVKLFTVLFDYGLALTMMQAAGYFASEKAKVPVLLIVTALPTVLINGACWGQCDTVYVCFIVLSLYLVKTKRPALSAAMLALAFAFKLQTIFFFPIVLLGLIHGEYKPKHALVFAAAYLVTMIPALLAGRPFMDALSVYANQSMGQYYDRLTYNAPNLYTFFPMMLFSNSQEYTWMRYIDGVSKDSANPYLRDDLMPMMQNAALYACVLLTLLVVFYWLTHAKEVTPDMTLDLALFFAIFLPFVMPKIHERYFFLADMLSILYAARYRNRRFMPLLVVGASLMSYMPILTRQRPVDERVLGLMMLAALVVVSRDLLRKMRRSRAELKAEGGKAA